MAHAKSEVDEKDTTERLFVELPSDDVDGDDIPDEAQVNGTHKPVRSFRVNPTSGARENLDRVMGLTGMSRNDVIDLALRLVVGAPREMVELAYADLQAEKRSAVLNFWGAE